MHLVRHQDGAIEDASSLYETLPVAGWASQLPGMLSRIA